MHGYTYIYTYANSRLWPCLSKAAFSYVGQKIICNCLVQRNFYRSYLLFKVVFDCGKNNFSEKLFFMKSIFPRKIDFHAIFSIVWFKINYFLEEKENT